MTEHESGLPSGLHSPRDYLDLARSDGASAETLRILADSPYDFVLEAVAANPSSPPDVLLRLVPPAVDSWNESSRLRALAENPSSDEAVLLAVVEGVRRALTASRRRGHPYEVAFRLVNRAEVPVSVLRKLGEQPGASARFRRRLSRLLIEREENERA